MKKAQVKLGGRYYAKVSGSVQTVRIDRAAPQGGWFATNEATGREIRIRTAGRLRAAA